MANDTKIAAVVGLSAAVGLGAWYFLRKKKVSEPTGDEEQPVYDRPSAIRIRGGDRGYGATAVAYDLSRNPKHPSSGSIGYRYGEQVTYTEPIFFGAQSYRGTRCVPTKDLPFNDQGKTYYLFGQARGYEPNNPGDTKWYNKQYQTGEGWNTNGMALIAKSWSCNPATRQGTNNIRCRTARNTQNRINLGAAAGGLGFMPFLPEYTQRFLDDEGDSVPFIEYGSANTGSQTGGRAYRDLSHVGSKSGGGFIDKEGAVWVEGNNCLNFRYIHDENPNIIYLYSMRGAGGVRTAMNKLTHTRVPDEELRPCWRDLSSNVSLFFRRSNADNFAKIDPWSIPGSPWATMDLMERKTFHVRSNDSDEPVPFLIDYKRKRGGNDVLRLAALGAPPASGALRAVRNISYVSRAAQGLIFGHGLWPIPSYGLIDPWRNPTHSQPNSMPYDFAMPIWMHVWSDMDYDKDIKFIGDVSNKPTTVYTTFGIG